MMYNEERKQKFLEEIRSQATKKLMLWLFSVSEKYENEAGLDLADMEIYPLQELMDSVSGVRVANTASLLYTIRRYTNWCKENGYTSGKAISQVQIRTENRIKERMIESPDHLARLLDLVFEPSNTRSIDCIYRVFLWLAFFGLDQDDAARVSVENIDHANNRIILDGITYPIYEQAKLDLFYAETLTEFVDVRYRASAGKYVEHRFNRQSGTRLLRGKDSGKSTDDAVTLTYTQMISRKMAAAKEAHAGDEPPCCVSFKATYEPIQLSGIFWIEYQRELSGEAPDFEAYAKRGVRKRKALGKYDDTSAQMLEHNIAKQARDFETDYKHWKSAFKK